MEEGARASPQKFPGEISVILKQLPGDNGGIMGNRTRNHPERMCIKTKTQETKRSGRKSNENAAQVEPINWVISGNNNKIRSVHNHMKSNTELDPENY